MVTSLNRKQNSAEDILLRQGSGGHVGRYRGLLRTRWRLMVSAGRLRPAREINQIGQDVKCLVALGINGRFFAVSLRVTAADQIRICIGSSSLRVSFWRN